MLAKKRTENLKILCPFLFVLDFTALSQINVEGFFVIFAAFFPWKTVRGMVKYACKVTSSECLNQSFTAVHEDIPKCMPEEFLHSEPVKLDIRGFESHRMQL